MKAIVQRVLHASVTVEGKVVGEISSGVLIYLGIIKGDQENQANELAQKIAEFRIFQDDRKRMNLSLLDVHEQALVISQFTLAADGKKGKRPSFDNAAPPEEAYILYLKFVEKLKSLGIQTQTGIFGSYMQVYSVNNGPVTFILEK